MESHKLHCICCGREMDNIMGDRGHQPNDGLSFCSYGHYGTTFFDPMDGSAIQIAVCDECLVAADAQGLVDRPKGKNPNYSLESISSAAMQYPVGESESSEPNISQIGGNCPVQAEGMIAGKKFYFRARGDRWSIGIGGDTVMEPEWYYSEPYGDEPYAAGWMTEDEARSFIQRAAEQYLKELAQ